MWFIERQNLPKAKVGFKEMLQCKIKDCKDLLFISFTLSAFDDIFCTSWWYINAFAKYINFVSIKMPRQLKDEMRHEIECTAAMGNIQILVARL